MRDIIASIFCMISEYFVIYHTLNFRILGYQRFSAPHRKKTGKALAFQRKMVYNLKLYKCVMKEERVVRHMKSDYVPNEKYRNMFGVERNGYGMERVDLYLAQLEVAFKKIREDNRSFKREASERACHPVGLLPQEADAVHSAIQQQELYISQLQAQLADEQEQNRRLHEQLVQEQLMQEQQHGQETSVAEELLGQISALRAEADELRQKLRQPFYPSSAVQGVVEEDMHSAIGKVMVQARQQAEETLREAQLEAEQIIRKAHQRVDELRAERDRVYNQLQGISFSVRNVLREQSGGDAGYKADYRQRGEELAAS